MNFWISTDWIGSAPNLDCCECYCSLVISLQEKEQNGNSAQDLFSGKVGNNCEFDGVALVMYCRACYGDKIELFSV